MDCEGLMWVKNYSSGSGSAGADEDYEIPPVMPPNHAEPSILHRMDPDSSYLCHALPGNSLVGSFSYPELPAIMMCNMLGQEGHLLSGQIHTVSPSCHLSQNTCHLPHSHRAVVPPGGGLGGEGGGVGIAGEKRPSLDMMKKPKPQKKKKKKDPNEPQKPVSAYALFFRDTQAAIKSQNPNATFGDVSKIVASMWDSLGEEQKQAYKRKTEAAKKEYLKALAAYRASLVSKSYSEPVENKNVQTSQPSHMMAPKAAPYCSPPQPSSPYLGPGSFPLSDLQSFNGPPHHTLSRTHSQSQMLPSLSASTSSSFQISPPLHQQLSLHQPIRIQQAQPQPIISHQMGLQASLHSPPPGQQSCENNELRTTASEFTITCGGIVVK
ncbi:hypothetical protein JZ751_019894 [Albula glossodonta]|uniref:HMG box domain-containing protein n=1 Tax=Albula glossodonta TaxID=121402 RepID=A0A8T2MVG1_9TELE|nr:hypothetical protein JZ751_019894 [Albula glossodonta]